MIKILIEAVISIFVIKFIFFQKEQKKRKILTYFQHKILSNLHKTLI